MQSNSGLESDRNHTLLQTVQNAEDMYKKINGVKYRLEKSLEEKQWVEKDWGRGKHNEQLQEKRDHS